MRTQVFDIGVCEPQINIIRDRYIATGLQYGWKSNVHKPYDFGHWNKKILSNSKYHHYDHSIMPFIGEHKEVDYIWNTIQSKIGKRALLRTYINGYTFGTDGYYHADDNWIAEKYGTDVLTETIIVYLNQHWNKDWGGETSIVNSEGDIEFSVLPKANRVLVFDSNKLHSARPLSRICPELRSVLVFKTIDASCLSEETDYIFKKTSNLNHTGRKFFEHLYKVGIILEKYGQSKDVCAAGMFHSIYGTEFYSYEGCDRVDRQEIRGVIGEYAESLVYEFCNLKNRFEVLVNNKEKYEPSFRKDLLFIEFANLIEQNFNKKYDQQIGTVYNEIQRIEQ